jgi:hypothetical protein
MSLVFMNRSMPYLKGLADGKDGYPVAVHGMLDLNSRGTDGGLNFQSSAHNRSLPYFKVLAHGNDESLVVAQGMLSETLFFNF